MDQQRDFVNKTEMRMGSEVHLKSTGKEWSHGIPGVAASSIGISSGSSFRWVVGRLPMGSIMAVPGKGQHLLKE